MKIIRKQKKRFYQIIAPKLFNEWELGEIPLYDLRDCIGRTLNLNLMTLTNDPKKQNINVHFQITHTDNNRALTEFIGFNIVPSSIRRMMRKKKIRIDDSFIVKTSDDKIIRLKPFLITAGFARSSATKGLKKQLREILKKEVAKMNYDSLIEELISHRLQSDLKSKLKKIYPLAICEIRAMEIEREKNKEEGGKKEKTQEFKEEETSKEIKKEDEKEVKEDNKKIKKEKIEKEEPKISEMQVNASERERTRSQLPISDDAQKSSKKISDKIGQKEEQSKKETVSKKEK